MGRAGEGMTVVLLSLDGWSSGHHRLCPNLAGPHSASSWDVLSSSSPSPNLALLPPTLFLLPLGFLPLGYNRGDNRVQDVDKQWL